MSRLPTVASDALDQPLRDKLSMVEEKMGFVPNSLAALANRPDILDPFLTFAATVMGRPGEPLYEIKALCAYVSSTASGCRYCQAHTASTASRAGISPEKIEHAFEFETCGLFTDAERAALNVAARAGMAPNAVEDDDFVRLREHYSDADCTTIMAMIGLFGLLNRWNDSLATQLEPEPLAVAPQLLQRSGWTPGKHGGTK